MQFKVPGGGNKRKDDLKMTHASGCEGGSTTYRMREHYVSDDKHDEQGKEGGGGCVFVLSFFLLFNTPSMGIELYLFSTAYVPDCK